MDKKHKYLKRFLAFVLSAAMVVTYMPTSLIAYANETDDGQPAATETVVDQQQPAETQPSGDGQTEQTDKTPAETTVADEANQPASDNPSEVKTEENSTDTKEEVKTEEQSQTPEEQPVDEQKEEEEKFPAKTFTDSANGVSVSVSAPEGALPEGTTMKVRGVGFVDMNKVKSAVKEEMGSTTKVIKAVDITFYDKNGTEVQPQKEVDVRFDSSKFNSLDNPAVVHVDDSFNADKVADGLDCSTSQFSIYVVVNTGADARLNVKFVKADGSSDTMMITKNQISHINQYIYDPGVGTLPDGTIFGGWTDEEDYTYETEAKTIADIRTEVEAELNKAGGVNDGDEITYYAMVFKPYTITYVDERGIMVKTEQILAKADDTSKPVHEVSLDYTPYPPDEEGVSADFMGWQQIKPEIPGEMKLYQPGDKINLEQSEYVLKAHTQKGHWLVFEENLKNATYTEPQFIPMSGTPEEPAQPTRTGYTFDGWYTEDASAERDGQAKGEKFNFNDELEANTTIYAKWNKATKADYKVVVWLQNKEGTGYDYSGTTITVKGATVGGNTYAITDRGNGDNRYARVKTGSRNQDYQDLNKFKGFHLSTTKPNSDGFDAQKKVAPEGNTVINVYYDRNTITYNFEGYKYTETTSGYSYYETQYGLVDGEYVELEYSNYYGAWYYGNYNWYEGTRYKRETETQTFSGLYGSDFTEWPDPGKGYVWKIGNTSYNLPLTEFNPEAVSKGSTSTEFTFYLDDFESGYKLYVYKMTTDGKWSYTESDLIATADLGGAGNWTPSETYIGYTLDSYRKGANGSWHECTPSTKIKYSSDLYLRYARNKYDITYSDGIFVNGNGDPVDAVKRTAFDTETDVYYEANISEYNKTPELNGFVFLGWYDNENCAGEPYTFNKMPAHNVTLYAKWGQSEYELKFHPNDSKDDPIRWNREKDTAWVADGEKVGNPSGERNYYDLVGWYYDEEMKHSFDFDAYVINKTTVQKIGHLYSSEEMDPAYPTTIGRVDLYAKWRSKLIGADGIKVEYDAGEGTNAPKDNNSYVDQAEAIAGAASTPNNEDLVFSHWEVQKWNGSAYENSGVKVLPRETFDVLAENAKITDSDGNPVSVDKLDSDQKYTYTVQLKAVYIEKDKETKTHITFYDNFGGKVKEYKDIAINQAVDIPAAPAHDGYIFLGWAREPEEGPTTDSKTLFLTYDKDTESYTYNNGTDPKAPATQVAADELMVGDNADEYHGMYAVWAQEVEVIVEGTEKTVPYNGAPQSNDEYKVTYKVGGVKTTTAPSGVTVNVTVAAPTSATGTDASTTPYESGELSVTAESSNNEFVIKSATVDQSKKTIKLTITPKAVTVTTGSGEKPYDGSALTKDEASIEGLVDADKNKVTVTATGSQTEVGSSSNTYSVSWGDVNKDNYAITESLGTLTVTSSSAAVTLTAPSDSKTYDGTALTAPGTEAKPVTASGLPEGFTVVATATGSQTNAGSSANVVNDGYVIKNAAGQDKTANFTNVTKVDGTLTVNKATATITTGSGSKPYDGTALTIAEAEITGLVNNETATVTATGSQTEVGNSKNTYDIDWGTTNKDNYTVKENLGTLTVTNSSVEVTLTAPSDSKTYDGTALTAPGTEDKPVTASGLPTGFTVEATATGSQTDAGSSKNVVDDGYVIKNAAGQDKTANFKNVKKIEGTLTVNKAPVTITTGSASKAYDGTAITKDEASITGLVNNETATVTATGSRTEVGESSNTYSLEWGTAKPGNYEITQNLGTLTITENTSEVTLTAPSDSKTYDGTALTAPGTEAKPVTASGLPEGFTVEATATGSQTDAGSSKNVVDDGYVIKNAAGQDKTANFKNVKKAEGTLTVSKAPVTIKTGSDSKEYDGSALTKDEASITGLVNNETATVTATGSQTEVGNSDNTYSIEWGTAKAANYEITEELGTLEVTKSTAEVTLTAPSDSKTYDGTALTAPGTTAKSVTASGLPEGFTVEATATGSQTDAGSSKNVVNDGYKIFDASHQDKTANFTNVKKAEGTLTVSKAPVTIKTGSDSKEYDGSALTKDEASITGLVNNETATVTATGSQTEVGSSDNTYSIEWGTAKAANYEITEELGTLEVTKSTAEVTLTAPSDSKTYDGTALTAPGTEAKPVTATGLPEGFTVEATATGSQTDAGSSKNVVNDGYVIKDAAGNDKTANFTNVKKANGSLTVNPKAVTITTGSDSKKYDGSALTKDEASIEGLVEGESVTLKATGSQTEVGSSDNTYSIKWDNAKESNYTVTENLGKLTVTETDVEVVLTAPSDSKTYDGTALTAPGTEAKPVTASGLPEGFTVEATATGSQTDAGSSKNVVNDGYVIKDAAGNDKTANFKKVKKVEGTLTVNPKAVTITTGTDSKQYDGTALTKDEASIEGLVEGESVTLKATGSQTEVGSSDNTYSIKWDNAKESNYTVTENLGSLTVSKNSAEVKLTAPSDEKVYDGTALTADGTGAKKVTASGLPEGFTVEATASGSQRNVGKSTNKVNDGYVIKNADGDDKTANFTNVKTVDGTLEVTPKPVTVKTGSGEKEYDGTALKNAEAKIEGIVAGEMATVKATGSQTEVGESDNTYEINWIQGTDSKNYTITENLGKLIVTNNSQSVTLTAPSDSKTYDGTALTAPGTTAKPVTVTGLPEGFTVEASATGSQLNAGESKNVVNDNYIIKNKAGENKTAYFTSISKVDGTLTVTPKAATVTTGSDKKEYDGTPLTKAEASIEGLIEGETVTLAATGSQTEVGSSDNTYSITWDNAIADNYTVTDKLGKLEVTKNTAEVTLTAPSDSKTYDGTALTADGTGDKKVTASGLPAGFTVEATASGSQTNAGSSDNVVNDGYVIKNSAGEDKTANFTNVKKVNGTLTVNRRSVTVTADDNGKVYGEPDPEKLTATIVGLVTGEPISLIKYIAERAAGEDVGDYTITPKGEKEQGNYEVTYETGTFTIRKAPIVDPEDPTDPTDPDAEKNRFEVTGPVDRVYDGTDAKQPVTIKDTKTGKTLVEGKDFELEYEGDLVNVTDDGIGVKITGIGNYSGEFTRSYKILPMALTITADSDTKEYDGEALTKDTYTNTDLAEGDSIESVTVTGSQTEVGSSDNVPSDAKIVDENGEDATANYDISYVAGKLTVTALPVYEITYDLNGGEYDGSTENIVEEHEKNEVIKIHEAPTREGYVFSYWKGSAYQPGDSYTVTEDHTFTAVWVAIEKTGDDSDSDSNKGVKTGDDNNLAGWLVMMLLAGAGIGGVGYGRRRKED